MNKHRSLAPAIGNSREISP